jgi:hypothetical protein
MFFFFSMGDFVLKVQWTMNDRPFYQEEAIHIN